MKDKVICCTPLLAYTLYIACYGIIDEWSNGCAKMIRPIGHVGILAPFIFMSMCENSIGNIVTYIMCISLAFFNATNELLYSILLASATYMMSNHYNMRSILMSLALLQLPIAHDSNIQDIFAHCGHIVLLSATGCVFNSNSFILACILAFAFVFTHSVRKVSPVIFILCALSSFITKYVPLTEVFTPWIYRTLWECKYGYITTASIIIYCTTLFSAALEYYCNVDVKLHALHVGGIAAVVIFIFPQVAPQSLQYMKIILFTAGLSDMSMLVLKASLNNQYGISDIIRTISCFTMILGVCVTNKPILDHFITDDSIRIKSNFKEIRLVVCIPMKRCNVKGCGQLKQLSAFGVDRHNDDGKNRLCKACVLHRCHVSREKNSLLKQEREDRNSKRLQDAIDKSNDALARHSVKSHVIEEDSFRVIASFVNGLQNDISVHQMHDGTLNDFAFNFGENACASSWFPQQLKASSRTSPPFTFYDCDNTYESGIVCVAPYSSPPRLFVYSGTFLAQNRDQLSGSSIRIGVRNSVWITGEVTLPQYISWARSQWIDQHNRFTLRELELQCSPNSQLEYLFTELSELMDPDKVFRLHATRAGVTDRTMDGMNVQDKSASRLRRGGVGLHSRLCFTCSAIPYVCGSNEWYCIHHVTPDHKLYIQWMIPETEMVERGVVSKVDRDGNVVVPGSGAAICHIADHETDRMSYKGLVQSKYFGGFPKRKTASMWTSLYCRIMVIPEEFEWLS